MAEWVDKVPVWWLAVTSGGDPCLPPEALGLTFWGFSLAQAEAPQRLPASGAMTDFRGVDMRSLPRHLPSGMTGGPRPTAEQRFWSKVSGGDVETCWEWTGALRQGCGYGDFRESTEIRVYAHRWAYEFLRSPIPPELEIDHLCRNRSCVNPWHLEPVTHLVNMRRGFAARRSA